MKARHFREVILLGITVSWLGIAAVPAGAQVSVGVQIGLPPPIMFSAPPQMVVLPNTYVYAVPGINEDIFFFDGFWWRPWQGHWYRSHYYDRDWGYYSSVPSFYGDVPHDWRDRYHSRQWGGQSWNYQPMPYEHVQRNWNTWKRDNYWQTHESWGVQGLKPEQRQQRQEHQTMQPQQGVQKPRRDSQKYQATQPQHGVQKPQRDSQKHQGTQQQHDVQKHQTTKPQSHGQRPQAQQQQSHGQQSHGQKEQSQQSDKGQGAGHAPKQQGGKGK